MDNNQHYVLRWHYQQTTLLSGLPKLLDSELFTDITLSVGCHNIKAHRVVLATCSAYFLQLFQDMGPLQHPVVILQDTDFNDLNAIISFIYRGQCLVSEKQLPSVLAAAKLLQIRGLCDLKVPENKPKETYSTISEEIANTNDNSTNDEQYSKNLCDNNTDIFPTSDTTKAMCENKIISNNLVELETNDGNSKIHEWRPTKGNNSNSSKCFICGKYLSNQYNLRVHMETHEDGYHACLSCPHVSRSRDALRKHISYRHPDENTTRKRKFKINS